MSWLQKLAEELKGYSSPDTNLNPNNASGFGGANMFNAPLPQNTLFNKPKPNPWGYQPVQPMAQTSMMQNPSIMNANNQ